MKIVNGLEAKLYRYLGILFCQLVIYLEGQPRVHALKYIVKVVTVYFDKLSVLQLWKRFIRLAGQIAQHPDNKGNLLHLNGIADLDVVSYMDPGGPHPVKGML